MDRGVRCELCGTPTVYRIGEGPAGVEQWRCAECGDFKRWCPQCDQGWIRRFRVPDTDQQVYSCDECEVAWPSVRDIPSPGTDRRSLLGHLGATDAWLRLELMRERVTDPPAA